MLQSRNPYLLKVNLEEARQILQAGGLLVYPTETYYALGCRADKADAIQAICAIKRRSADKPLPLIATNEEQAAQIAKLSDFPEKILARFWPGPLTIIEKTRIELNPALLDQNGNVAIRVSSETVAAQLATSFPIVATSANLAGCEPQKNFAQLAAPFLESVISTGMACGIIEKNINGKYRGPSTIVKSRTGQNKGKSLLILRAGCIPKEALGDFYL